jgi:aminoglycoside 3-N-acetyltransferase
MKNSVRPLRRQWLTQGQMVNEFRNLGIATGDLLLVHSSLSAIGFVPGGPNRVLDALQDTVGTNGTLVFPTHSWEEMDLGCRTFDARCTKSCVGILPEFFRLRLGVNRSLHPTHSVAVSGPLSRWLITGHENCLTPCGADTPYDKLLQRSGRILFIGTGLRSNTAFHTAEALAGLDYLMNDEPDLFTIVDSAGQSTQKWCCRHRSGIERRFADLEPFLIGKQIAKTGMVGEARCILLEGSPFLKDMMNTLRDQPDFLLAAFAAFPQEVN